MAAEQMAQDEEDQKACFRRWMNQPEVRFMISLIPSTNKTEGALETLLEACFSSAWYSGASNAVMNLMGKLMKKHEG